MIQNVGKDVGACKFKGKGAAVIDNAATGNVSAAVAAIVDVAEVTVGMRIVQCAVFAKVLYIIAALHLVQQFALLEIRPRQDFAVFVKIQPPGITAAFGEQFELFRAGMITPDALLELDAANVRRHRAALRSVKPAIRSPR